MTREGSALTGVAQGALRGQRVVVIGGTSGMGLGAVRAAAAALGRQALHAFRLEFPHPITNERIVCEAPLPADMREALRILGLQ